MITFIPTPIGNPKDITLRALEIFQDTKLFFCEDTRETKRLLRLLSDRFDFVYPDDATFISLNEHNGRDRITQWGDRLREQDAVYVSDAGMPIISDPGEILVEFCQKNNIPYDILPGASAVVTAYAASGFEDGKFLFFGFLPHKGIERDRALNEALNTGYATILYESPHRLMRLMREIESSDPDRVIFLAKELTKKFQRYYKNSAHKMLLLLEDMDIRGEWVVIIEAKKSERASLYLEDILSLDIAPKPKAKLLSRLTGESTKSWYERLISL
jgi:16S rRNA (cytidine1402-2'-O)-methyltransferase